MRKPRSFQLGDVGETQFYHCVTRVAGQEILFYGREKDMFVKFLRKQLRFSGLSCVAYCFMGNHIHLLLEVPDKETQLADWTEEDYIDRLRLLRDEYSTRVTLGDIAMYRENGHTEGVKAIAGRVRARLFDLSAFMKEFKLRMTGWYNAKHGRKGTLWEGRFKCVLVEGNDTLEKVAAYIDLNPLRAGLVADPLDYRWCSYAVAVGGDKQARAGYHRAVRGVPRGRTAHWSKTVAQYRMLLYALGQERDGSAASEGGQKRRGGFTPAEVREVLKKGGRLPLPVALSCQVRYFLDGVVLGSEDFVNRFFEKRKSFFGSRRKDGARRMRGAEWGEMRCLRMLGNGVRPG